MNDDTEFTELGIGVGNYFQRSDGYEFVKPDPRIQERYDLNPQERVPDDEGLGLDEIPMETAYYHLATESTHDDGMVGLRVAFTVREHTETGNRYIGEMWRTQNGRNELMRMVVQMRDRINNLEARLNELE